MNPIVNLVLPGYTAVIGVFDLVVGLTVGENARVGVCSTPGPVTRRRGSVIRRRRLRDPSAGVPSVADPAPHRPVAAAHRSRSRSATATGDEVRR